MPTSDAEDQTLDFVVAVLGAGTLPVDFLVAVGAMFEISPESIESDPTVPLSLGETSVMKGGRTYFHFSAYESERAHADAYVVVVGDGPTDLDFSPASNRTIYLIEETRTEALPWAVNEEDCCRGNLRARKGIGAALKLVARGALERSKNAASAFPSMPHCVREAHHRPDRAGTPPLPSVGSPAVGMYTKVQVQLREPMVSAIDEETYMSWLAMGGRVTAVLGADSVEAELVATTSHAPKHFTGHWRAQLIRDSTMEFPWIVRSLTRDADETEVAP